MVSGKKKKVYSEMTSSFISLCNIRAERNQRSNFVKKTLSLEKLQLVPIKPLDSDHLPVSECLQRPSGPAPGPPEAAGSASC